MSRWIVEWPSFWKSRTKDCLKLASLISCAMLLLGCPASDPHELLFQHLKDLAGREAKDCGSVPIGGEATEANACVLDAFDRRVPFFVRYDVQGLDSKMIVGLAASNGGQVFSLKFDNAKWDSQAVKPGQQLLDHNHTLLARCESPVQLKTAPRGYLTCSD